MQPSDDKINKMANSWFKFYGGEYLSDPKMLALTASGRSCWITLLCYTSVVNDNENDNAQVKHITEERLMIQAGIDIGSDEWEHTKGILEKFKKLEMIRIDNDTITILNWKKRQQSSLTPYERVKRFREKKRNDNGDDVEMITLDKNREDKNREDNTIYPDFDLFWKIYPKHVGKKKTFDLWKNLPTAIQQKILEDIPKRMKDRKWIGGFIKDPERYIKNEQWNDDIIAESAKPQGSGKVDRFIK